MEEAESRHNNNELQSKENRIDEVEKSLELLDKVLSEFEDNQENSLVVGEPESPSLGHQSEDDGYMSMNGKRTKFLTDAQPSEEVPNELNFGQSSLCKTASPTTADAEVSIPDVLPRQSPSKETCEPSINSDKVESTETIDSIVAKEVECPEIAESENKMDSIISNIVPLQSTLPKTRPSSFFPSRYASLPSSNTPKTLLNLEKGSVGNVNEKKSFGGIGINEVHSAVLKSGAKIPESIINEHPVTIYPGPLQPQKRVPPRTLPYSFERHREVCRKNLSSNSSSPTTSLKSPQEELETFNIEPKESITSDDDNLLESPILDISKLSPLKSPQASSLSASPRGIKISIQIMDNLMNNRNIIYSAKLKQKSISKNNNHSCQTCDNNDNDDDNFSDDSLEETSLPPPAPPPVIPPPPSLSAPVTPSKRHSIAWEVNLDDLCGSNGTTHKTFDRCLKKNINYGSESQSQTSICSSPDPSSLSNKKSKDWPDLPDLPLCSTEDEACSIYSDSDGVIAPGVEISDGGATFVIRKGRRRQPIVMDSPTSFTPNPIISKHSNENLRTEIETSIITFPKSLVSASINIPNSRRSLDLGASPRHQPSKGIFQNIQTANSPRSRLSLDLSSDANINFMKKLPSTSPSQVITSPPVTKTTTPTSPLVANDVPYLSRYSEFKTYSSTFDGLQALENHSAVNNASNNCASAQIIISPDNALARVSSSPTVPPQNPLSGDCCTTPNRSRELDPPIEEDEEDSENKAAPLRQIENNISALLRGEIQIAQVSAERTPQSIGFRLGVHKSESAKEMLLSQNYFGPLPPSPISSSSDLDCDEFPPLPPSPSLDESMHAKSVQNIGISTRGRLKSEHTYRIEHRAPAVPPHAPSLNTLKTRSMDAEFSKFYRNGSMSSPRSPGNTLPSELPSSTSSRRRVLGSGFPKRSAQSPREERRLQTSCSLPETPIFARGCDIPRTPHARGHEPNVCGSRTNPRHNSINSSSIVGIGTSTINSTGRQMQSLHRNINHPLQANGEMFRLSGLPARGWYPKQRHLRTTASTDHLDRIGSARVMDSNVSRKTTTLPPNMTPPKFFNKSPRDALRRVTSLLISRKGNSSKEKDGNKKHSKNAKVKESINEDPIQCMPALREDANTPSQPKKKGFFKGFWKKSRHYSLEQH